MLKQITREQAEEIFSLAEVVEKTIEQSKTELNLSFSMSNKNILKISYNIKNHHQTFFLDHLPDKTLK
jgi:hypothetical protein